MSVTWLNSLKPLFDKMKKSTCLDDWQHNHSEKSQSLSQFIHQQPITHRSSLYFMTLGRDSYTSTALMDITSALIGRPMISGGHWKLGESHSVKKSKKHNNLEMYEWIDICEVTSSSFTKKHHKRHHPTNILGQVCARISMNNGNRQLRVDDILKILIQRRHQHGSKMILMLNEDLFSEDDDLFIAGLAHISAGVAAFSIYRYAFGFYWNPDGYWFDYGFISSSSSSSSVSKPYISAGDVDSDMTTEAKDIELLRRYARLCAHEMMHLFGINHCLFYRCLMNGSGHLLEDLSQPLLPCPIDMSKLCHSNRISAIIYLTNLLDAFQRHSLTPEATFVRKMIAQHQSHS